VGGGAEKLGDLPADVCTPSKARSINKASISNPNCSRFL
jgi:hypothetical protein